MHDGAYSLPHRADARALGRDILVVGHDGDLGAVSRLTGDGLDLHHTLFDLGHLHGEEPTHQIRVGTRDDHLGTTHLLAHRHDEDSQPASVAVVLARHLLIGRHDGLEPSQIHSDGAGVAVGLLDHTSDDVALHGGELAVLVLVLGLTQPLEDHLTSRGGSNPAEVVRGGVVPSDDLALVVLLRGHDGDIARLAVDVDPSVLDGMLGLAVGVEQRVLKGLDEEVERDLLLTFNHSQCGQIDVHVQFSWVSVGRLSST